MSCGVEEADFSSISYRDLDSVAGALDFIDSFVINGDFEASVWIDPKMDFGWSATPNGDFGVSVGGLAKRDVGTLAEGVANGDFGTWNRADPNGDAGPSVAVEPNGGFCASGVEGTKVLFEASGVAGGEPKVGVAVSVVKLNGGTELWGAVGAGRWVLASSTVEATTVPCTPTVVPGVELVSFGVDVKPNIGFVASATGVVVETFSADRVGGLTKRGIVELGTGSNVEESSAGCGKEKAGAG